jgi:MFS family permease
MAPYEEEENERRAKPKWLRKTEKFFKKKAKKMFGKKKKSGGQDSSSASSSEEENRGERRETTSFRRLKSSRSTKWDPDILAAWGGNPLVYSQEEPSENSEVYNIRAERVTDSIYHSPSEAFLNMDQDEKSLLQANDMLLSDRYYEDDSVLFYENVPMVRLRMIYFVICFAFSIYSPFFVLYMKNDIGLSAGQVGLVAALQIVGGYVVGPLISLLVDKFRIHKPVWIAAMLLCIIPVEMISLAKSFHSAIGIALFIAALNAPISSLMDSSTLCFLGPRSHEYGKIRFFGAVGWGLGSLVAGLLVQMFGNQAAFHLFGVCMVVVSSIALSMDFTVIHEAGDDIFEDSLSFFHSITLLIPSWSYVFFLGVSIVAGFGATSLQSLLLMFLSDLGASNFLEGLTLSVATISELPIFWASGTIIKKYGASSLLCASMIAFTVRAILVSFLHNPWMVLPLQLLHGFTFAGAWTAGVALAKENSPVGFETSGQSIFSLAYNGVGGLAGSVVGGQLYDLLGPREMYRVKAMVFAVTVVLYLFTLVDWNALRLRKYKENAPHSSAYHRI